MLLPSDELASRLNSCDILPHWDPALVRNRRLYLKLVKTLHARGLLTFLLEEERREEIGVFFVKKKDNSLRLIIDARRSNLHFASPPGVSLVTAEGLSRLEVEPNDDAGPAGPMRFTLGTSDISDAFHRFRIDRPMSGYFCLRPVAAAELGLGGRMLGGRRLRDDSLIVPACAALPMGFTWSLFFCQEVGRDIMRSTPELAGVPEMSDRGATTVLRPGLPLGDGGGAQYTYVDNLGVLGFEPPAVEQSLAAATDRFDKVGLLTHETAIQVDRGETLGCRLDGVALSTRLTEKRYWRLRQGLSWALSCRALPGWVWEVIIGHCTYCAMCNRDLLPAFSAIYKFIAANYGVAAPLWDSARRELVAFRGLMPLIRGDWALPWSSRVCLSDASEHGYAVCASVFEEGSVKEIGRVQERSRFRRLGGHSARAHFSPPTTSS